MSRAVHPALGTALVASGGFGGAALRYGIDLAAPASLVATLLVNGLGCLALGLVVVLVREGGLLGERTVLVLATGFISSFTTYSTFVLDAVQSTPGVGAAYVVASYGLGVGATVLGRWAGRWLLAPDWSGPRAFSLFAFLEQPTPRRCKTELGLSSWKWGKPQQMNSRRSRCFLSILRI